MIELFLNMLLPGGRSVDAIMAKRDLHRMEVAGCKMVLLLLNMADRHPITMTQPHGPESPPQTKFIIPAENGVREYLANAGHAARSTFLGAAKRAEESQHCQDDASDKHPDSLISG